jgi:signal transduction histidine kinase
MRALASLPTPRPIIGRLERRLVFVVGRIPIRVQTKLLVAFLATGALLVVVGLLGLRVIGDSNDRVEQLAGVQDRATFYRELQSNADQVRQILGLRVGIVGPQQATYAGGSPSSTLDNTSLLEIDGALASTVSTSGGASLAPAGLSLPASEEVSLQRIQNDYTQLTQAIATVIAFDKDRTPAQEAATPDEQRVAQLVRDLHSGTQDLADAVQAAAATLVAEDRAAFADSQRLFIAVAVGSIVLALLLGYLLSRSLVGPITATEARLAAIASGDFSEHVTVGNRDELGALAANLNRMNDELGRLYAELETASRHKSEFLANMSHELRTPLNAIIGFSDLLGEQMYGPLNDAQQQYVSDVRGAGRHLLALINDILDLSKVEAGRMELSLSDVSIADTLEAGVAMNRPRAARNDIALDMDIEPGIPSIRGDERKIRQVLFNLLSNAIKFTPPGGRISVRAVSADGNVEVAVSDTGPGIALEDQERIFEEFQQAGAAARSSVEGTGLGLTLSRRFIELHGGRLWVTSEPGAGSTFRFTLPIERAT